MYNYLSNLNPEQETEAPADLRYQLFREGGLLDALWARQNYDTNHARFESVLMQESEEISRFIEIYHRHLLKRTTTFDQVVILYAELVYNRIEMNPAELSRWLEVRGRQYQDTPA